MSPCGTEQTLDLIKRALTGARTGSRPRAHTVMCASPSTNTQKQSADWPRGRVRKWPSSPRRRAEEVAKVCVRARARAHTRWGLTSSTFCIRNRAVACGKTQTPRCFGLPSCPRVNHHAKLRLTIQTTAALAWTSSYPPKASAAEELTHEQEAEEEQSRKPDFKEKKKNGGKKWGEKTPHKT